MDSTRSGSLNPFDDLEDDDEEMMTLGLGDEGEEVHRRDYRDLPLHERPPNYQLRHHWNEIDDLIQSGSMDPFALEELREHIRAMEKLLIRDKPEQSGQVGPCLKLMISENIIEALYMFSTQQKVYVKELRIMLLRFFTEVLARASQPLLIHQQILRPISRLLRACEGSEDKEINSALIPFLHQLCILMQENQSLLDLFFETKPNMKSKFLIFVELIPHMHGTGEVGNRARDAILLCLSLAAQLPASNLSHFIADESNFCQVRELKREGGGREGERERERMRDCECVCMIILYCECSIVFGSQSCKVAHNLSTLIQYSLSCTTVFVQRCWPLD